MEMNCDPLCLLQSEMLFLLPGRPQFVGHFLMTNNPMNVNHNYICLLYHLVFHTTSAMLLQRI